MPIAVLPIVIPAMPVLVVVVAPLLGSPLAPFAAIGIEATEGQAQGSPAEGQDEKRPFHVHSRVGG